MNAAFSTSVLGGMIRKGFSEREISTTIELSMAQTKAMLKGKAKLTGKQLELIERAAGLTGGQLAALHLEPDGGSLTKITNLWAGVAKSLNGAASPRRRGSRTRQTVKQH